jgi:hypothetical protein
LRHNITRNEAWFYAEFETCAAPAGEGNQLLLN